MPQDRRRPQPDLIVESKLVEPKVVEPKVVDREDAAAQERKLQLVSQSEVHATHVAEVMRFLRNSGFDFSLEVDADDETMPRTLH
jgi:hypothetical protein